MAITKVSDLNSLFNTLYEDALYVARETNVMLSLVRTFSAVGWMNRVVPIYAQVTAQSVGEGIDFANPTTLSKSASATFTPAEIMAQVLLTDRDIDTDPDGARQAAAQELGGAIATKIDTDIAAEFINFTASKGSAGNALTIAKVAAGIAVLRNAKAPQPLYVVLHPYGWHDIWTELGQPAATYAALGESANQALRDYFMGAFLGAQWFINANIAVDASDDASGAVFNRGALGFDSRKEPVMEPERDASLRAWELNFSAGYDTAVIRDAFGVELIHDATAPT